MPQAEAAAPAAPSVVQIPAVQAVIQGSPPGIAFPKGMKTPAIKMMVQNKDALLQAGLSFYRPKDKSIEAVMFNEASMSSSQVEALDKAGVLKDFFPPFLPESDPFLQADREAGGEGAPAGSPTGVGPTASGTLAKPASAKAQAKIGQARKENITPDSPADSAKPGSGSILNAIGKRAV